MSFHFITENFISKTYLFWCLCMYGLHRLLPTCGEKFMSIAPLEVDLPRKMETCSTPVLPAVYIKRNGTGEAGELSFKEAPQFPI